MQVEYWRFTYLNFAQDMDERKEKQAKKAVMGYPEEELRTT